MKLFRIYLIIVCLTGSYVSFAQKKAEPLVKVIKFRELQQLMQKNEGIFVMNFWASWCSPCVSEMPAFQTLANELAPNQVKFFFISLDFKKDLKIVQKFVKDKKITSPVYLLDEPDYDSWINKISPQWTGSIPATLIGKGKKKEFYEQSFDYQTLKDKIRHFF
jgi:thiol-disulfide isomerase/thioredoxin